MSSDWQIKTRSVEKALEPLVYQVTTLCNTQDSSAARRKGKSKKAHVLVAAVQQAIRDFITHGEQIASENAQLQNDLLAAVEDIRHAGDCMTNSSKDFGDNPCSSEKRTFMVEDARRLLTCVTRLLILADMSDVNKLIISLSMVEEDIDAIRRATSQQDVVNRYQSFGNHVTDLSKEAARRQFELIDPRLRDDLASARATLKRNQVMLLTSTKSYVRHPELPSAKENRDYVLQQVSDAVSTIQDVARGQAPTAMGLSAYDEPGELAAALDEFDERIIMHPFEYHDVHSREMLEKQLESIITGAALMADMSCTRDDRRERIVTECNSVRQALQDLLTEYVLNSGKRTTNEKLDRAREYMCRKTRDLRRHLRKAVVDHVSDSFLETNVPLMILIEASKAGSEHDVEDYGQVFEEHAKKLVEVAHLACSMSDNEDGVKMVRYAAAQVDALYPQVINAARVLASRPNSKVALENMDAFRQAWENQVRVLTDAVDDITTIDDFLAVSESHILEDINKCVISATDDRDADVLDRTAGAIRGRCARVCNVVEAEMENYEPGAYTRKVLDSVKMLRGKIMSNFADRVQSVVNVLNEGSHAGFDHNDFIDSSRSVYEAVREVRRCILLNRNAEDVMTDEEIGMSSSSNNNNSLEDEHDAAGVNGFSTLNRMVSPESIEQMNEQQKMRLLPEEERQQIAAQVEVFKIEKIQFDKELGKWDDTGNDAIVLSKHMCMIMMEMTDFTRGKGPLKTTNDVIKAAQKISEKGKQLNTIAKQIAEQCPESTTKQDLLAYLDKITLFCHQLEITSRVKADVQNIGGEQVVSALDSATSLIQAAKNLMNAVVLTVKASFVASTKYTHKTNAAKVVNPIVVWKMRAPDKKPLVKREKQEEQTARVRRGSLKKSVPPIKALAEFESH